MTTKYKCDHCKMIQPDWWIEQGHTVACKFCTYPALYPYESKPIKINCNWCQTTGGKIKKDVPVKDYVILG
jgi:DNA-directed RNA polymerase subunit RPC12/RpoP